MRFNATTHPSLLNEGTFSFRVRQFGPNLRTSWHDCGFVEVSFSQYPARKRLLVGVFFPSNGQALNVLNESFEEPTAVVNVAWNLNSVFVTVNNITLPSLPLDLSVAQFRNLRHSGEL